MTPLALPQQRLPVSPGEPGAASAAGMSPCPLPFPVEAEGRLRKANDVFVKVYLDMVQSGLLAELSGTELKVLLALGLAARRLGGDVAAEHHFERLKSLAVVTEADRGRLFCYLARDTIALQTGLSTRTVSTAGNALVNRHLLEKRSVRNHSGRHDYNVYFILPASRLGPAIGIRLMQVLHRERFVVERVAELLRHQC